MIYIHITRRLLGLHMTLRDALEKEINPTKSMSAKHSTKYLTTMILLPLVSDMLLLVFNPQDSGDSKKNIFSQKP